MKVRFRIIQGRDHTGLCIVSRIISEMPTAKKAAQCVCVCVCVSQTGFSFKCIPIQISSMLSMRVVVKYISIYLSIYPIRGFDLALSSFHTFCSTLSLISLMNFYLRTSKTQFINLINNGYGGVVFL